MGIVRKIPAGLAFTFWTMDLGSSRAIRRAFGWTVSQIGKGQHLEQGGQKREPRLLGGLNRSLQGSAIMNLGLPTKDIYTTALLLAEQKFTTDRDCGWEVDLVGNLKNPTLLVRKSTA